VTAKLDRVLQCCVLDNGRCYMSQKMAEEYISGNSVIA